MKLAFKSFLVVCSTVLMFGCGNSHHLEIAEVEGVITCDGRPVTQGVVIFIPVKGKRATGKIDSEGRYCLTTYSNGDGAIVGLHKVGVVAYEDMRQYYLAKYAESDSYEMPKAIVAEKYGDPFSSGLTFHVEPGKTNQADFPFDRP
ncbi:MAG: hypothetical protein MI725_04360 [Pirellulales bacterium]|nr:hypothetical protein [Pirellulales bacterium]